MGRGTPTRAAIAGTVRPFSAAAIISSAARRRARVWAPAGASGPAAAFAATASRPQAEGQADAGPRRGAVGRDVLRPLVLKALLAARAGRHPPVPPLGGAGVHS